jgi:hypothetical protein
MAILCGHLWRGMPFARHSEGANQTTSIATTCRRFALQITVTVDDATLFKIVVFLVLLLH